MTDGASTPMIHSRVGAEAALRRLQDLAMHAPVDQSEVEDLADGIRWYMDGLENAMTPAEVVDWIDQVVRDGIDVQFTEDGTSCSRCRCRSG